MRVISANILLACVASRVAGQNFCDDSLARANFTASSSDTCNCPYQPACNDCITDASYNDVTECANRCIYCVEALGICGSYSSGALFDILGYYKDSVLWTYTEGRTGTLRLDYDFDDSYCAVTINDEECTSCSPTTCTIGGIDLEINCTNIEAGATSDPCTSRVYGGWASLDDSALNGLLGPLAIPYYGCKIGTTTLKMEEVTGTVAPVGTPPPPSGPESVSSESPSTTSGTTNPVAPVDTPAPSGTGPEPTANPPTTSGTSKPIASADTPAPTTTGPEPSASPPTNLGAPDPTAPVRTLPPAFQGPIGSSSTGLMPVLMAFLIPLVGTAIYHFFFGM